MATYYTKKDAASRLGVSVKTLDRRIKKGELRRTIIHGPHGPEIRVLLDGDTATPDVAPATNLVADHPPPVEAVQGFAPPTNALDIRDRIPDTLVLQALAEARREGEAWARRYGRLEAERDALRAAVESLRRPWWRKGWEKVRRRQS